MREFLPVPWTGQFGEEVLFINALAPAEHLREVALRRITAVENLLQLMEDDSDSGLIHATARLASALAPLVSEARQLYELALERPGYKAGPTQR
ncbi:hypothetical protein [Pseudomonas nitroreducens]|uniref:hypothetical protein n=1 Tax=Pseudomonas nitroreducens TaxID=46680 RepID=UPI002D7FA799|nr:hypothetical protein [Pseudomonas nitroreducens]